LILSGIVAAVKKLFEKSVVVAVLTEDLAYAPAYDITDTSNPTLHSQFFTEYGASAALAYYRGSDGRTLTTTTKTLPINPDFKYYIGALAIFTGADLCDAMFEFLNASGVTIAVIKTSKSTLQYGANTSTSSSAPIVGSGPYTDGNLSFNQYGLTFESNLTTGSYFNNFTFSCSASTITQVRISNVSVKSVFTTLAQAYVILRKNGAALRSTAPILISSLSGTLFTAELSNTYTDVLGTIGAQNGLTVQCVRPKIGSTLLTQPSSGIAPTLIYGGSGYKPYFAFNSSGKKLVSDIQSGMSGTLIVCCKLTMTGYVCLP